MLLTKAPPRTVDDQLVGVVDADPPRGMQRDREAARVEHRPVDADPMAAGIEDDIVPDVLCGPGIEWLVECEDHRRRHGVESEALDAGKPGVLFRW